MGNDTESLLNSIFEKLDQIRSIDSAEIPNMDLYMDQVTTFMDRKLRSGVRNPGDDKILTKTMINNYAKNSLLPSPVKKKYSKEHVLLLIFIFYYKNVMSISDIQTLLQPLTEHFFQNQKGYDLRDVYEEVRALNDRQIEDLKTDVQEKFRAAKEGFADAPERDREFLRKFALISMLSFEIYEKKLIIEKLIDDMAQGTKPEKKKAEKAKADVRKS